MKGEQRITLNSRERVILSLNHKEPDRVPLDIGGTGATTLLIPTYDNLKRFLNIESQTKILNRFFQMASVDDEMVKKLNVDLILITPKPSANYNDIEIGNNSYIDEWGIICTKPTNSIYYSFSKHPLSFASTANDIKNFKFPNPIDETRFEGLKERIKYLSNKTRFAIVGETGDAIFERAWYLRGMENIFNDMFFNKKLLHYLLDKISDFFIEKAEKFLEIVGDYIQVFFTGDDLGTQNGPLISPRMYKEFIMPYHKRVYGFIKSKTKAKLILHSCGSIFDYLPYLIGVGVDGINPVQSTAFKMEAMRLKKCFGKELSFWGGIDTQKILPFGSDEDLRKEVLDKIVNLSDGGGYILSAVHSIQLDVSPEKIVKMLDFGRKYGFYRK